VLVRFAQTSVFRAAPDTKGSVTSAIDGIVKQASRRTRRHKHLDLPLPWQNRQDEDYPCKARSKGKSSTNRDHSPPATAPDTGTRTLEEVVGAPAPAAVAALFRGRAGAPVRLRFVPAVGDSGIALAVTAAAAAVFASVARAASSSVHAILKHTFPFSSLTGSGERGKDGENHAHMRTCKSKKKKPTEFRRVELLLKRRYLAPEVLRPCAPRIRAVCDRLRRTCPCVVVGRSRGRPWALLSLR
jgi:hypothetical protein